MSSTNKKGAGSREQGARNKNPPLTPPRRGSDGIGNSDRLIKTGNQGQRILYLITAINATISYQKTTFF